MLKKILLIFFIFINLFLYSNTIILKKNIYIDNSKCSLQDISSNKLPNYLSNIIISNSDKELTTLSSDQILKILFSKSIYDITLVGDYTIINFNKNNNIEKNNQSNKKIVYRKNPLEALENYFESFLDSNIFTIKIDSIKTDPELNIKIIKSNFNWKLKSNSYSLNDIKKIKKMTLIFDNNEYSITLDTKIYSNIWNAKQSFQKNDSFKEEGFIKHYVDISKFSNIDSIIFDIKQANNSTFIKNISHGETLKWNYLKKNPSVNKGESINAILVKNQIEIVLPCIALNDGYDNKKIKAKLVNGKEIFGTVRNYNGEVYIEIL